MATFQSPLVSETLTRADFDEATFRRVLQQKGLDLEWQQAAECPCQPRSDELGLDLSAIVDVADSGVGTRLDCPVCNGSGLIYHSAQDVKAVITGAEDEYIFARFGGYRDGVINITVNPEHLPSFGDRFVLKQSVMLYRESLDVGTDALLSLRFPIAQRDLNLAGGAASFQVIYSHVTDPATGLALVGGELTQGVDFNVVDGKISWVNKPDAAARVSFTYFMNPSYIVISYPNSIRDTKIITKKPTDTFVPLPVKVQAKLEFLEAGD